MRWLSLCLLGCSSAFLFPPRGRGIPPSTPAPITSEAEGRDTAAATSAADLPSTAVDDAALTARSLHYSEADGVPSYGLIPYKGRTVFNASLTDDTYPTLRSMTSRQLFVTRFK